MPVLKINEGFDGFTIEQSSEIARAARRHSKGNHKNRRRMPTCVMADDKFTIVSVRSTGMSAEVRRQSDGKWIPLNGPATIFWLQPGQSPCVPPDADTPPDLTAGEIQAKVASAVALMEQSHDLAKQAGRELWGIPRVHNEREWVVRAFQRLHSALLDLKRCQQALENPSAEQS